MNLYDFSAKRIDGHEESLSVYRGKVLLIVNVASRCVLTAQYPALQALYERYVAQGFEILGFPCNQFGSQEPKSNEEIQQFCSLSYNVTFPMFAKIDVNGADAAPVYRFLKSQAKGFLFTEAIKWNFTKFLVARDGHVVKRYSPQSSPAGLNNAIERQLAIAAK